MTTSLFHFVPFLLSFHSSSSPFSSRPSSNSDPGVISPVPTSVREFHLYCEKTSIQPFLPSSTRVDSYPLQLGVDITLHNIYPPTRYDICIQYLCVFLYRIRYLVAYRITSRYIDHFSNMWLKCDMVNGIWYLRPMSSDYWAYITWCMWKNYPEWRVICQFTASVLVW